MKSASAHAVTNHSISANSLTRPWWDEVYADDPLIQQSRKDIVERQLFAPAKLATSLIVSSQQPSPHPLQKSPASEAAHVGYRAEQVESQPLVVGVSGGADSIVLLHLLAVLAKELGLELHVAHLNHNLRPEAASDAAFVAQMAAALHLPFHIATIAPGLLTAINESLEGAARQFRYRFLTSIARAITPREQAPMVAVAHHADDQAETVLMNLLRGSGMQGLSGMSWRSDWRTASGHVQIIRPFLGTERQQILDFLQRHRLPWVEDESNQDQSLLRNKIRHAVMPVLSEINPNLTQILNRTAEIITVEQDRATTWDSEAFHQIQMPTRNSSGRCVLDWNAFGELTVAAQRNILRLAVEQIHSSLPDGLSFEAIDGLLTGIIIAGEEDNRTLGTAHPLFQNISWTVGRPDPKGSLLISIHQRDELPFVPSHPLLDAAWQRIHGSCSISVPGCFSVHTKSGPTCQLQATIMDRKSLPTDWNSGNDPWCAYFDAAKVTTPVLTTPKPGQRFAPLGMKGRHQLIGDLFTNLKILQPYRVHWPIIVSQKKNATLQRGAEQTHSEVVWVCGLRVAHSARIIDQTTQVLYLKWRY